MGVKILVLAGDVFDRGLPLNHRDVGYILSWARRLMQKCARLGIMLLIIEGTPSHDRLQSHIFVALNDAAPEDQKCKLRYVKEVSIEHIEEYDINILCVPDEKNLSDDITLDQVKELMKARALEQVDFAVMHGFFDFQVPVGRTTRFHDSKAYIALVRYLIWIGHDHVFRQVGNIFVQGSPDRQRHGMEEDKGWIRATVYRDGTYTATFEVNEYAMVFKTITVSDDVDTATRQVYDVCDSHHERAHIRIVASRLHPIINAIDSFKLQYPFITFTKKFTEEETSSSVAEMKELEIEYIPLTIDSSNIKKVAKDRLDLIMNDEESAYFESMMESVT